MYLMTGKEIYACPHCGKIVDEIMGTNKRGGVVEEEK
jgi:hypothetical protein